MSFVAAHHWFGILRLHSVATGLAAVHVAHPVPLEAAVPQIPLALVVQHAEIM